MVDTCAGEFPSATPYLYSSYDEENEARAVGRPDGRDPRQRPQPDRAGGRVRLLLRPRGAGVPGAGLPHRDGELESGDRLHRLRHLRRALLRAAHAGGRARDRRTWSSRSGWWCSSAGRRRSGWRAALEKRGRPHPRHLARGHRPGGGPRPLRGAHPRARRGAAAERASRTRWTRRSPWRAGWATRCWCARPTCWAAARWRSSTTTRRSGATSPGPRGWRPSTRC